MNQLCHFLKGGYTGKVLSSPVLMSSTQMLQNSLSSSQNSWFKSIFSNSFFKNKKDESNTAKRGSISESQILQIQKESIESLRNSSNSSLSKALFGDVSSINSLTGQSSSNSSNMWNKQSLIDVASRNNERVENFLREAKQGNKSIINMASNMSNSTSINNVKQLQQQLQYNVISTKEFHLQKKNYTKVKAFLKEFALLLKEGTKDTYSDGKWYFNLLARKNRNSMTGYEVRQSMRIRSDLFKIIPFSFFVIVPAAELLLPVYLLLFPNAMPSQYTFDYAYDQYIQSLEDNQAAAHEILVQKLKTHLMENCNASIDHFLHSDTYKQVFFKNFRNFETNGALDFNTFTSDELITVCRFLGMECITGTYIISKILNIAINTPIWLTNLAISTLKLKKEKLQYSKFSLSLNFGPFEVIKRQMLLVQIKRHISLLRLQDQAFFKMGFHDIVGHRITDFARERGITTITCYETLKAIMSNEWVNVCINRKFNDNAILWYAIMQYDFLRNANNDMN